jgi:hypothetical protein
MRIVMAGHYFRVPQALACCVVVMMVGAGMMPAVAVAADDATSVATSPATSAPAPGFLPVDSASKSQTPNGADLIPPAPPEINVVQPVRSPLQLSATGIYMYGSVKGSVQVPKGGKIGTSNADRPHFDSVGINYANIGDFEVAAKWGTPGEFFVGAQIIRLDGAAFRGATPLTTNGIVFPARSRVTSVINLDWYRVGYRYTIPLNFADNGIPDVTFTPWVEGLVLNFDYNLSSPGVKPAHKSYAAGGIQIGATFAWRPNGGPLSLEASLGGFPTITNLATISVESLYARYHFYDWRRFDFTGLLGVAFEQQSFRDDQPLANHIDANFGPMLLVGLQVKF